jgi:hypothetical protein
VRYRLAVILGLGVCAVLAGARSFTAIAEWAADADKQTLTRLGVTGAVPSESTFRRTLQRLDAGAFDDLAGGWAAGRTAPGPKQRRAGAGRVSLQTEAGNAPALALYMTAGFHPVHGLQLLSLTLTAKDHHDC